MRSKTSMAGTPGSSPSSTSPASEKPSERGTGTPAARNRSCRSWIDEASEGCTTFANQRSVAVSTRSTARLPGRYASMRSFAPSAAMPNFDSTTPAASGYDTAGSDGSAGSCG